MEITLYDNNLTILENDRSFSFPKITYDNLPPGSYFARLNKYPANGPMIDRYNIHLNLFSGTSVFDIDGNGEVQALTDGLLILRYLFGFSGDSLVNNAIGDNATRQTPEQIKTYIESM